jgi:hypothetical protein
MKELRLLETLKDRGFYKHVVLISTDSVEYQREIKRLLEDRNLGAYEQWMFNQDMPERLRYAIDPNWYGELPRAYIYDEKGRRVSYSGMLKKEMLEAWLESIQGP